MRRCRRLWLNFAGPIQVNVFSCSFYFFIPLFLKWLSDYTIEIYGDDSLAYGTNKFWLTYRFNDSVSHRDTLTVTSTNCLLRIRVVLKKKQDEIVYLALLERHGEAAHVSVVCILALFLQDHGTLYDGDFESEPILILQPTRRHCATSWPTDFSTCMRNDDWLKLNASSTLSGAAHVVKTSISI